MNNPEKLAAYGIQKQETTKQKHNTICVGHHYLTKNCHFNLSV